MFFPLITLLLISFCMNVSGYVKPPITSTTTTTTKSPKCHSPNQTEATRCGCWQTCEGIQICQTCFPGQLPECKCSKGYVLYGYDHCVLPKDCPCKGPNEVYTLCSTCEGTCADPNPICIQKESCGSPMCQCKVGYVRGPDGVCIPPYSCPSKNLECTAPPPATTPTTPTTKNYGKRIHCYSGELFLSDCVLGFKNRTKCLEEQKEQEQKSFKVIQCGPEAKQCYSLRQSCHEADGEHLAKGCDYANSPFKNACQDLRFRLCRSGDANRWACELCKGDNCNKKFPNYPTTEEATTKSYN